MKLRQLVVCAAAFVVAQAATAQTFEVRSISPQGVGETIGTISLAAASDGVSFTPKLAGFAPGAHAFHVHQKPDCGPGMSGGRTVAGFAAGGHYMGAHAGMTMAGMAMAGDLPDLVADKDGRIAAPVMKTGLTLEELHGKSVMIHRYPEKPTEAGQPSGGGERIACGIIP